MFKYEPEANLHGFYLVKTNAVYKAIGHADFAAQTDGLARSLVLGLALAFLFTYAIFKVIGQNLVGAFYVPWHAIAVAVVLVIAIVFLTERRAVGQLEGKDLAEELKLENT